MQIVEKHGVSPRLLSSAALEVRNSAGAVEPGSDIKLGGASIWTGNGRALFVGLFFGAVVICGGGWIVSHQRETAREFETFRKFMAVRTAKVEPPPVAPHPKAIAVRIPPDLIRVTAIALGHPRIAIINGKELTEGESVKVRVPNGDIEVSLRVVKIRDGAIELTDGTQIVTSRLQESGLRSSR